MKRFERSFELWKECMQGIFFLKDCEGAMVEKKQEIMQDDAWTTLNKKAVTYVKLVASAEIFVDIKGLTIAHLPMRSLWT